MYNQYNKKNRDVQLNDSIRQLVAVLRAINVIFYLKKRNYQQLYLYRKRQLFKLRKLLLVRRRLLRKRLRKKKQLLVDQLVNQTNINSPKLLLLKKPDNDLKSIYYRFNLHL